MTSSKNLEKRKMKSDNMKKYIVFGIVLALLLISFGGRRGGKKRARSGRKKLQCQEKYNGTTICNYEDHPKARMIKVTSSDKDTIVELFNQFRSQAEPPAANMQKVIWDEKLARFAQKWARVCKYGHDNPLERRNPEYKIPIGQNVAYGYRDWASVLHLWNGEIRVIHRAPNTHDKNTWTKQLRDVTARVGCGVAYCPQFRRCYVCNYAFGDADDSTPLYKEGSPCSDCPNTCDGKLCDCKGKICLNGGTLSLANCKCKCPRLYGGSMCSKLKCPRKDRKRCGKKGPNGYTKNSCKDQLTTRMECPYMCGLCKREKSALKEKSDKKKQVKKKKQTKTETEKSKDGAKTPKSDSKTSKSASKNPKSTSKNPKSDSKTSKSVKNPESSASGGKTSTSGGKKEKTL